MDATAFGTDMRRCHICNVTFTTDEDGRKHYEGKRHAKLVAAHKSATELCARSVFLYGFTAGALTNEAIAEHIRVNFQSEPSKVQLDPKRRTCAIVEFESETDAQRVLNTKKLLINEITALVKSRQINTQPSTAPKTQVANGDISDFVERLHLVSTLDEQMAILRSEQKPDERRAVAQEAIDAVTAALRPYISSDCAWRIELYGSCATQFATVHSDIDLTIICAQDASQLSEADIALCRNKQYLLTHNMSELRDAQSVTQKEWKLLGRHDQARFVTRCLNEARKQGALSIQNLTTVHSRRCPLVHFVLTLPSKVTSVVDISINNTLGIANTQWLNDLCAQRPVVADLITILRAWAHFERLVDSDSVRSAHLLSNYSLALMAVHCCQAAHICQAVNEKGSIPQEVNVLLDDVITNAFTHLRNALCGAQCKVLNVRDGTVMDGDKYTAEVSDDFQLSTLNVADPFVVEHNTTAKVARRIVLRFQRRVQVVAEHLRKRTAGRTVLNVLFPLPKDVAQRTETPVSQGAQHTIWRFVASEEGAVKDYDAWVADTATAVLNIFTKVLLFVEQSSGSGDDAQMMETDNEEPAQKRQRALLRQWTKTYQLETHYRAWIGRRTLRKQLQRQMPDASGIMIECTVSEALLKQQAPAEITVGLLLECDCTVKEGGARVDVAIERLSGALNDYNDCVHFIDTIIQRLLRDILPERSLRSDDTMML